MTDAIAPALAAAVNAWIAEDPDPVTRAQAQRWLDTADVKALAEAFGPRLAFGTAGLRGTIGAGPGCMNRALVRRVAAGLAHYLLATVPEAQQRGVVIGYDGRHGSRDFSEDTASVLAALGFHVWLHADTVPTPQLGHAVTTLAAAAGIMVTASHNPPKDNGYKVYWSDGAQIIPPHDAGISAAIDALGPLSSIACPPLAEVQARGLVRDAPDDIARRYLDEVHALRVHAGAERQRLRIVYTAMHGVGWRRVRDALTRAGHELVYPVREQRDPDADFPTVAFPNPEEPGALDLAMRVAADVDAEIILASDPDGDRLAVCVPDGAGGWRQLTGNQVGVLLADDLLTYGDQWKGAERLVATTIVSTTLLSRIAAAHGARYAEALTGFKWIANAAIPFDAAGGHFVVGFEEALGYSVGPVVRDKDGVSAALLFADLAAFAKSEGKSVLDRLEALYRRFDCHASYQRALTLPGVEGRAKINAMLATLRASPPRSLAGTEVVRFRDLAERVDLDLRSGTRTEPALPAADVLAWDLSDGARVLARPSGTEPKIKFYFEAPVPMGDDGLLAAEARGQQRVRALARDFLAIVDVG